jgi:hypothetical protein
MIKFHENPSSGSRVVSCGPTEGRTDGQAHRHDEAKFYIFLTVHLGPILVNNQLDALSLMYLFISLLYMFPTAQCSSSGDQLYYYIIWYD